MTKEIAKFYILNTLELSLQYDNAITAAQEGKLFSEALTFDDKLLTMEVVDGTITLRPEKKEA